MINLTNNFSLTLSHILPLNELIYSLTEPRGSCHLIALPIPVLAVELQTYFLLPRVLVPSTGNLRAVLRYLLNAEILCPDPRDNSLLWLEYSTLT